MIILYCNRGPSQRLGSKVQLWDVPSPHLYSACHPAAAEVVYAAARCLVECMTALPKAGGKEAMRKKTSLKCCPPTRVSVSTQHS